jgi:GntR family transcriptional repressor for pyruvate dehydrogenase complex
MPWATACRPSASFPRNIRIAPHRARGGDRAGSAGAGGSARGFGRLCEAPARQERHPGFNITAFELTEARLLFEGEAAALAATQITEELAELEALVEEIERENQNPTAPKRPTAPSIWPSRAPPATRRRAVERLWDLRAVSPESALLHEKARSANIKPVVDEHTAVLEALRAHDPAAARAAMRAHLAAVLDSLLFATEEKAIGSPPRRAPSAIAMPAPPCETII